MIKTIFSYRTQSQTKWSLDKKIKSLKITRTKISNQILYFHENIDLLVLNITRINSNLCITQG